MDSRICADNVILIAEDDDGHAELIRENLIDAGLGNEFIRFKDGREAWEFLNREGEGPHRETNRAYLLLLDINMPRMGGMEVLKRIKSHPELKSMPVIMLTTTDDPREIRQSYELGCSCYITKPVNFNRFVDTLKTLGLFIMVLKVSKLNGEE